jgi:hypothetical protein
MLRVFGKSSVDGVARVTNRHVPHEGIDDEIHSSAGKQCQHARKGLTSREKKQADQAADGYDHNPQIPVEVLLNVQRIMPASDAISDETVFADRGIQPQGYRLLAAGALWDSVFEAW